MANLAVEYKKGSRGRPLLTQPTDSDKVLRIVFLRNYENMRWRQIGEELGISHQAPFLLHKKWHKWVDLSEEMISYLRDEMELRRAIEMELRERTEEELRIEVEKKLRKQMENRLRKEVEDQLRKEIEEELRGEMENKKSDEIGGDHGTT